MVDNDAGIGSNGAVLVDDQRIEVHLDDPRQFADHFRDAQQDLFQRIAVDRRHVVELVENLGSARRIDQILGQELVQRRQGDRTVGEDLVVETAGAEGDHWPEDRVTQHADHDLAAVRAGQEGLDRDAVDLGIRVALLHRVDDVVVGVADRRRVLDVEADAASVGLVRQIG